MWGLLISKTLKRIILPLIFLMSGLGFKTRNGLANQRYAGNAESTDPQLIELATVHLRSVLGTRLPGDTYNINETAFQHVLHKRRIVYTYC